METIKYQRGNCNIYALNKDVALIMRPLIKEMEEGHHTLNEEDFIAACTRLHLTLTPSEKAVVLNIKKSSTKLLPESTVEETFSPLLNYNSVRMQEKSRPDGVKIEEILISKGKHIKEKLIEK